MIYCYPLIILREIGDAFVSSFVFPLKGNMIYLDIRYSIFHEKMKEEVNVAIHVMFIFIIRFNSRGE